MDGRMDGSGNEYSQRNRMTSNFRRVFASYLVCIVCIFMLLIVAYTHNAKQGFPTFWRMDMVEVTPNIIPASPVVHHNFGTVGLRNM